MPKASRKLQQLARKRGRRRTRDVVKGRRERPDPALFAGKGKVEEIAEAVAATECAARDLQSRAVPGAGAQSRRSA